MKTKLASLVPLVPLEDDEDDGEAAVADADEDDYGGNVNGGHGPPNSRTASEVRERRVSTLRSRRFQISRVLAAGED